MANHEIQEFLADTLGGIFQCSETIGDRDAPILMSFWGDLQCRHSRTFALSSLTDLLADEVRSGQLRVRYRPLPSATTDPSEFFLQHSAAIAAGKQGKLWDYVDAFYLTQREKNSGYVTPQHLTLIAEEIEGLDSKVWLQDLANGFAHEISESIDDAGAAGITSTPGLLLTTDDAVLRPRDLSSEAIREAIAELNDAQPLTA